MSLTAEQIQARKRGVGSSEALAALGKDSRCSRLELYMRKVGELPDLDLSDDERVHFGNLLEPVIRDEASRRLKTPIIVPQQTLFHPIAPLCGHPDGWMPALNRGIEIKTCDKFEADEFGEEQSDQVPIRYLVQCAGYMALTNADSWHLAVLIGGNELRMYEIPRDPELENALLSGITQFWQHVERREPPAPGTPDDVRLRWTKDASTTAIASDEIASLCLDLADTKMRLKEVEQHEIDLKAQIQQYMQEAAQLVDADGQLLATWKSAKASRKFDDKSFAKDHPDLFARYQREVPGSRRFLLK